MSRPPKSPLRLHHRFLSRGLHNHRDIVVWLPPGYGLMRRRHPVVYFALWHPRVFGHVAALSPALAWDDRTVLREFSRLRKKPDVRLWLDMGTAEPGWEGVRIFRDTLLSKSWQPGEDFAYREVAGAGHSEQAWAARLGDVLKWLLPLERGR